MNYIKIKTAKVYLDNRIQISPHGREFRMSAIRMNNQIHKKYIEDVGYRNHWFYIFKYSDDSFFGFEFDYYDKYLQKLDHENVIKLLKY